MNALERLMREIGDDEGPRRQTILPEAAIERLKEAAQRFHGPNPFKVGDIVTVREDAPMKGAGRPHLVVAINDNGFNVGKSEFGSWSASVTQNVQFIWTDGEHIVPHTAAHWMLEPFNAN